MKKVTDKDLEILKKEIPHKWRLQSAKWNKASCVAYIDARDAQDLLDEAVGAGNWQVKYNSIDGGLFASIGIKIEEEWVWKSDTGSESNIEKEKGEVSDSFKRAAVAWGVGRFLYRKSIITFKSERVKPDSRSETPYVVHEGKKIYLTGDKLNRACIAEEKKQAKK